MSATLQERSPAGGTSTMIPCTLPCTTRGSASSEARTGGQQRAQARTAPPRVAGEPRRDQRQAAGAQGEDQGVASPGRARRSLRPAGDAPTDLQQDNPYPVLFAHQQERRPQVEVAREEVNEPLEYAGERERRRKQTRGFRQQVQLEAPRRPRRTYPRTRAFAGACPGAPYGSGISPFAVVMSMTGNFGAPAPSRRLASPWS